MVSSKRPLKGSPSYSGSIASLLEPRKSRVSSFRLSLDSLSAGRAVMATKKPDGLLARKTAPQRICPVCGVITYSRGGIHPQCAQERADAPRVRRIKAAKKVAKPKVKVAPKALSAWHKLCPKCRRQVHVRKQTCDCGHKFS